MASVTTSPTWVFAYGSNMALPDLQGWFERAGQPWGRLLEVQAAQLPGFRLVWNFYSETRAGGAANVERHAEHTLHGLALLVDDVLFAGLDRKEGYPQLYDRTKNRIALARGESVEAWVYEVRPENTRAEYVAPTRHYRSLLVGGARTHGLPSVYIAELESVITSD